MAGGLGLAGRRQNRVNNQEQFGPAHQFGMLGPMNRGGMANEGQHKRQANVNVAQAAHFRSSTALTVPVPDSVTMLTGPRQGEISTTKPRPSRFVVPGGKIPW